MKADEIILQTKRWIQDVVVAYHFCPFAKTALERDSVRYVLCEALTLEHGLLKAIDECIYLDSNENIETTLIIFSNVFKSFDDFLDGLAIAEQLLIEQDYEGVYQLASFHPDYCFADSTNDDAANYTNRSPFPTLQLLREASIEKVLLNYPEPENIPERNMDYARAKGLDVMKAHLSEIL